MIGTLASCDVKLTPAKRNSIEDVISPAAELEVGNDLEEITGSSTLESPRVQNNKVTSIYVCFFRGL